MAQKSVHNHNGSGIIWFVGWLFTIGYLKLSFLKSVLGILVWPYFLGAHFAGFPVLGDAADASAALSAP